MSGSGQTSSPADDWGNYWQGRAGTQAGAALVGVGVERDPELDAVWREALEPLDRDGPLLDVATGAGTVLRSAAAMGFTDLTGLDISPEALAALSREMPGVRTVVGSASEPPFAPGAFHTVTSQFGFEYAGAARAARALAPLVRDGGAFIAVAHLAGGAIAEEVEGKRSAASAILDSGFVPLAKAVFAASDADFAAAAEAFGAAQNMVLKRAKAGDRMAAHLYAGTQKLHERRRAYTLEDIHGWLDSMAGEFAAYRGRMEAMLDAALGPDDAAEVVDGLRDGGLEVEPPHTLEMSGRPAALVFRARR